MTIQSYVIRSNQCQVGAQEHARKCPTWVPWDAHSEVVGSMQDTQEGVYKDERLLKEGTKTEVPPGALSMIALHWEARPGQTITHSHGSVTGYGLTLRRRCDLGQRLPSCKVGPKEGWQPRVVFWHLGEYGLPL